ncbi:hypothetical protein LB823_17770 [Tsukamurella sp. M9C]|uniref:DUF7373 family lipoprotein n=1 Tax=unclassified Tsukamurella TaxID=2633480 RepID=UPI001CC9CD97|nr:hypothetical protein [Tsukamurella sp. M9C]MCA0158046.1 hypothetical protein [Tsukamurella sp. M9C]
MEARSGTATAAVALVVGLLSACSTVVAGTPVAETTVSKVDPGNFPTTPRAVTAQSAADAWQQEGMIIADAVVAPSDIRSDLTVAVSDEPEAGAGPLLRVGQLIERDSARGIRTGGIPPRIAANLELNTRFDAGFATAAGDSSTAPKTQLAVALLRFTTDDSAEKAMTTLRADIPPPAALARIPGAVVVSSTTAGGLTKTAVAAPVNNLISLVWATTRGAGSEELAIKGLAAQVERSRTYVPTVRLSGLTVPAVPMDKDGIMSRTLASQNDSRTRTAFGFSSGFELGDGYYSPRTRYLMNRRPDWLASATRNGVDLVGNTARTTVLRARDPAAAKAFLSETRADPTATAYDVPGFSRDQAGCDSITHPTQPYSCYVTVGRWAIQATSTSLDLARQSISAAYLINKAAGEK